MTSRPNPRLILNLEELRGYLKSLGIDDQFDEVQEELLTEIVAKARNKSKVRKNKRRIQANDAAKSRRPALESLTKEEISSLPNWVQSEIKNSIIVGDSGDVIQIPDGRKYHKKNKLNDLSGGEWTFFLNSVTNTRFPTSGPESYAHEIRKIHPSPKPPQLMREIIEFFTKEKDLILDFFMGVGGSLLGASLANRRAIGIDLNGDYISAYKRATTALKLREQVTLQGDSLQLLADGKEIKKFLKGQKFSLILIDPPYGDMLAREKTGDAINRKKSSSPTPFTNLATDLGNMGIEEFFPLFRKSIVDSMQYLKSKGHIAVFMKDLQPTKSSTNLLHARVIEELSKIESLNYIGLKIWADQGVNLYPYGYPFSFVANQIHQYIMFFRMD